MIKSINLISVFFLFVLSFQSSFAQEFDEYLTRANKAYEAQDYELVKLELEDALRIVSKKVSNDLQNTFPEPLPGWEGSSIKKESNAFIGVQLTKIYRHDGSTMTATLTHGGPMEAH